MSINVYQDDLSLMVNAILSRVQRWNAPKEELMRMDALMLDIANSLCKHYGGKVVSDVQKNPSGWFIEVEGDLRSPSDGGIWNSFDPDGDCLFDAGYYPERSTWLGHWYLEPSTGLLIIIPNPDEDGNDMIRYGTDTVANLHFCYSEKGSIMSTLWNYYYDKEAEYKKNNKNSDDWFETINQEEVAATFKLEVPTVEIRRYHPFDDRYYLFSSEKAES